VGKKKPNGFGLHDMHGNVSEWCWDWYSEGYYKQSGVDDPTGPAARVAPSRVLRGGSLIDQPADCRPADRNRFTPAHLNFILGFRVALGQSGR
jgi:sulfatase modifying factor 1